MRNELLSLAIVASMAACTIGTPEGEMTFESGLTGADEGSTGGEPDPDDTSAGSSTGGEGSGGSTSGDPEGSTGSTGMVTGETSGGGSTGDVGSTGGSGGSGGGEPVEQPASGAWSHCLATPDCNDETLGCLNNGGAMAPTDGVCTAVCAAANDPSACPEAPLSITATLGCVLVNTTPVCALMCETEQDCPGGMNCMEEDSDLGTVTVCM